MGNTWDERERNFEERPVRTASSAVARVGVVLGVAMFVFGVFGVLHWGFGVFTSDVKGRGDAEIVKNEAYNRIRAQEGFWVRHQGILQADKNLNLTAEQLKSTPDSVKLRTELNGQKMICNELVGQYNAAAHKFTQRDFRDAELPFEINDADPATDCKENSK